MALDLTAPIPKFRESGLPLAASVVEPCRAIRAAPRRARGGDPSTWLRVTVSTAQSVSEVEPQHFIAQAIYRDLGKLAEAVQQGPGSRESGITGAGREQRGSSVVLTAYRVSF